jgi:hypothetical protein
MPKPLSKALPLLYPQAKPRRLTNRPRKAKSSTEIKSGDRVTIKIEIKKGS